MFQSSSTLTTPLRARDARRTLGPPTSGDLSVLLVEDDAVIRALVHEALAAAGFRVCIARDGFAALTVVRRDPPDVVVLDLGLPILDGQEFVDAWRTAAPMHSVPIVVLSASAELPPLLARAGVQGYITKPFDIDILVQAVRRLAAGRRR
jgi:two-component system, OmpR family, KDP operon response regulator KdpE